MNDMNDSAKEQAARRSRRLELYRSSVRTLSWTAHSATLREQLEDLVREAGAVHDLDEPADVYGNGVVEALEGRVAGLLGMEDAAFFPTGTMAQQVALRCWAGRTGNRAVALHPLAHPEVHERNAFGEVSGLRTLRLTDEPRLPTPQEIHDLGEPFGALMLELPLRDAGFVLPTWEELTATVAAARELDAVVHFDGARLWESTVHLGHSLEEIAGLADSVYVSFYKSLQGLSGAVLAGPASLVAEAKVWRHRYGGLAFQQFPAALSALVGLERELPRLPEYVAHAKVVAQALAEGLAEGGVPWSRVHPEPPHTHQFQVWLPHSREVLEDAALAQGEETGRMLFMSSWTAQGPGIAYHEMTVSSPGLDWDAEEVREAARDFARRLPARG
ncbi:beta-eliminating lyase-related protein [Streptomyces sp. NPDC002734]|uniref:threonine aldolase family protein n=1 Tax=Streptomyces sp. NPDC002734 TaxID=3154426 RepID=UPI00331C38F5